MRKRLTIGSKTVDMAANAATPFWYKQIFNKDFFVEAELFRNSETTSESIELYTQLAFVMAMQAKKKDMTEITTADYVKFLEGFAPLDFAFAIDAIAELYAAQEKPSSKPKK